jgi:hypothetical protein
MVVRILVLFFTITTITGIQIVPLGAQERVNSARFAIDPIPKGAWDRPGENDISFQTIPEDIGRNFHGLFSSRNLMPILIGTGLTGLTTFLDEDEFENDGDEIDHIHESGEESSLGRLGQTMGHHVILPSVVTGLAVTGQIVNNRRFEHFSYSLVHGYIVNNLLTRSLKAVSHRTRPNRRNDLSFPSGHTSNAFTWATILGHYYGKKVAIPAYGVASFIAWSRLNMDAHYLSDVAFGAFLGYVVGRTVVATSDERAPGGRLEWYPTAGRKEAGIIASYRW